jgi:hypothetical protein
VTSDTGSCANGKKTKGFCASCFRDFVVVDAYFVACVCHLISKSDAHETLAVFVEFGEFGDFCFCYGDEVVEDALVDFCECSLVETGYDLWDRFERWISATGIDALGRHSDKHVVWFESKIGEERSGHSDGD